MTDSSSTVEWVTKKMVGHVTGQYSLSKNEATRVGIDLDLLMNKTTFAQLAELGVYMLPYSRRNHLDVILTKEIDDPQVTDQVSSEDQIWLWPKQEATLVLDSINQGENIIINGPTGCGKSMLFDKLSEKQGKNLVRINLHNETDSSALIGERIVGTDQHGNAVTPWMDGVAITCWEKGYWLLLDELDFSQPEHIACVQRIAEEYSREFILAEDEGRKIFRNPRFRLLATANSLGITPNPELYTGTADLNEAFLDRWTLLQMDYHPEEEKILDKIEIDSNYKDQILELVKNVRNSINRGDIATTFSTRKMVKLARKLKRWEVKDAIQVIVLNKLRPDVKAVVEEMCTRIFPEYAQ